MIVWTNWKDKKSDTWKGTISHNIFKKWQVFLVIRWCAPRWFSTQHLDYQWHIDCIFFQNKSLKNHFRLTLMNSKMGRLLMTIIEKLFWLILAVPLMLRVLEISQEYRKYSTLRSDKKENFGCIFTEVKLLLVTIYKTIRFLWIFYFWQTLNCFSINLRIGKSGVG